MCRGHGKLQFRHLAFAPDGLLRVQPRNEILMMVVPDKGGVSEWWMAQKRKGVVGSMAGISQEVKKRLPGKMMLGRSSTPTLGKIVKRPAQSKGVGKGDTTGQE